MLSIQLNDKHEWWVSGKVFERLFQSALDGGKMPPDLEHWRHVADANGGLNLSRINPLEANEMVTALRDTAEREIARLRDADPATEDGSYCTSLLKLLEVASIG
jgi:hypothetical protein